MRTRRRFTPATAGTWLLLALLPLLSHRGAAQVAPSTTLTFSSTADTYVDGGSATTNFNSSTILRADASPVRIIYLRFAVSGVNGRQVRQARLRLGVNAASAAGGTVYLMSSNSWNESTVTFNTKPAVDGAGLQTLGAVTAGSTVEFTLDGAITADGTYNLAIDSANSAAVAYNSSLASSGQKPQLVLTVAAQAPTVTISQPPTGSSYFTGDTITLQASAHDSANVDLSSHVTWSSNLAGSLGTGAVVSTSLGAGTHTITASVTDGQSLTGSSQVTLTVNTPPPGNTAPLLTITAPSAGQTFASSAATTLTASASDLEDGDLSAAIQWTSDRDGALGTGGSVSHMLSEGTHQLTATVTDRGGLTATATVTVEVVAGVALEFPAVADASVDASVPTTNFGTAPVLAVDANAVRIAYLRFDVTGLASRTILGAVLRLQADGTPGAESDSGGVLHTITDGTWQESTVTYSTKPAVNGPTVASQGRVALGQTVEFNAAAAVTGDGTYNFAIVNQSSDECDYRSREGGPAPTLVVAVARSAPAVTIAAPASGAVVVHGDPVRFAADASDAEDGDVSSRIVWMSSRDGALGAGAAIMTSTLSIGLHTVTAAATNSGDLRGEAQVDVRVRAPNTPPVVTIGSPADGSSVPAGTAVRLGAVARDDFDGDLTGLIRWTSSRDGALGPNGTRRLSEGAHTLVASVTDSDGAAASATARLTVTPTAPDLTIAAPADGTTVFVGTSVAFSGTATDATDGDLSAALRWLSDRDGQIGAGPAFSTASLSTGTHTVTATAADSGGLTGSAARRVVVRPPNVPPVVRVVAPAAAGTFLAGRPVLLAAAAADAEDGDLSSVVGWTSSRDGALGTGRTVVVPGLSLGTHTLTASVTDRDGAVSSASVDIAVVPATLVFTPSADTYVDSGSASAKFGSATSLLVGTSPVRQSFLRFAVTGTAPFRVQQALLRLTVGTASADGSAVGGTVRAITNGTWSEAATAYSTRSAVDGAVLATRTAVKPKDVVDFDVTSGVAGDGTVNLAVVSSSSDWVRYASREATTGRPELRIALTENTPPVVTVLAPATAARVLPGSPVVFTAAAIDAEDGDLGSRIAWSSSLDGPLGTGPTVTAAALRPGLHTVTARVTDAGGLVGQATVAITVVHPPAVTIVAPADGTVVFTSGLPLTLTARATDVEDGDLGAHITWTSDRDGALGTGSSIAAGALTVGTHVIDATVTDADGLRGSTRISVRVRAPNVPPRVTITGPADGTAVPAGTPLTLGATAVDDFDGDVTAGIRWTSSRDGALAPGPVRTATLSEGSHTLVASVTDSDGAVGTAAVHVTIAPSPPVVTITAPADGSRVFAGASLAFAGTALDVTDGDLTAALRWTSDRDGAIGTGAGFATTKLSIGTHVVTASVADTGGLTARAQRTVVVRPPNVPPAIAVVVPAPQATLLTARPALLVAAATDVEDGNLGASVRWTSSRDGVLGSGAALVVPSLSVGTHTLTASVTDADGAAASASVVVAVVPSQLTLLPIADTYVDGGAATTKFGTTTSVLVGTSPVRQAFFRFLVNGIGGFKVQQALLRLTVGASSSDGSAAGGAVHAISTHTWPETTTTFRTRPVIDGPALVTAGKVVAKQVVDFNVTAAVAADGMVDFALDSTSSDWVRYATREATSGKPQLLVSLAQNLAPVVTITAPAPNTTVDLGTPVAFSATAVDAESGDLGPRIVWTSDRDGVLGGGAAITAAALSPGIHTIVARVTDAGGRTGEARITLAVASPPVLTIIVPADGTRLVPGVQATFSAVADDADEGDLTGSIIWTSSLDGVLGHGGTIRTDALRSGTHTITASVTDSRGKVAAVMRTVVVNAEPSIAITAPADGATFIPGESVLLRAVAQDREDGDLAAAVAWRSSLDGPLGTGGTLAVTTLRSGLHGITASVTDAGGLRATATIVVVVNAVPTVTIAAPAAGATFAPGDVVRLVATATDVEDGDLTARVSWSSSLDGALGTGGTIATARLRSGTHVIRASATDRGGKTASAEVTVTVNAPPMVTITVPLAGATFVPGDAVRLQGTATDAEDGDLGAAIAWASDLDGALGAGTDVTVPSLRSGTHTITATVRDSGGKTASVRTTIVVNAPPQLRIVAPSDGSAFVPGDVVRLQATATDVEDGDLGAAISWSSSVDGPLGGGATLDVTLHSGTHTLTAAVADAGGERAGATIVLVVNAPPALEVSANGTLFAPGDTITLTGAAHDLEDGDLSAEVTWASSLDGPLGEGSRLDVTRLRAGTHTITASVVDRGGKTASAVLTVVVDAPPVVRITGPADGFDSVPGAVLPFTATATDDEDGTLDAAIVWTSSVDGPLGSGALLRAALHSGRHTVTASVTDSAGRTTTAAITVVVNAPPALLIGSPQDGATFVPGDVVPLTAMANDAEDGDLGTAIRWTSSLDGPLGGGSMLNVDGLRSGTHVISAQVTDGGGKSAAAAITVIVNAAPRLSIVTPTSGLTVGPADAVSLVATATDVEDGDLGGAIEWTSSLDGPLGAGAVVPGVMLRSGLHTITAAVQDSGGRTAVAEVTVTSNAAPHVSIDAPADGSLFGPTDSITLSAAATDLEDGNLGGGVAWTSDLDGALGTGATLVRSLRSGTHTITATVTDAGGKTARAAIALVVNTAPTVRITGPADGSLFAPTDTITLTGTAEDAEDGDLGTAIVWTSNLDGTLGTGTSVVPTLRSGTHTISASVTDRGGKSAVATLTLVVNAAPTIQLVAPASDTTFAPDEPVTLTAGATDTEDGDLSGAVGWSSSVQGPLGSSGTLAGGTLVPGTHVLTASVTDSGGRSASATTTIVVAPLITLQGSRSTGYTNLSLAEKTKIDATQATFFASPSNLYPVNLDGGAGARFVGGDVLGQYDRTLSWDDMHSMNNAGIAFDDPQFTVDGMRADNVTDGVRPKAAAVDFTIRNVHLSYTRDDCVENDHLNGGLVDDSLFDGCYDAFSARPSQAIIDSGYDGRSHVWTIQNSLVRLEPMPGPRGGSADNLGNGGFFKWHNWDNPSTSLSPKLALYNNVFMAERVGQPGKSRMGIPPDQLQDCANNVMVWLGPGSFPATLPSCFTVTTDRSVWDDAVADWLARHPTVAP